MGKFLEEITIAHADGSFPQLMANLQKMDLILLDDFGLTAMDSQHRHDLFNLIEARYQLQSTIVTVIVAKSVSQALFMSAECVYVNV